MMVTSQGQNLQCNELQGLRWLEPNGLRKLSFTQASVQRAHTRGVALVAFAAQRAKALHALLAVPCSCERGNRRLSQSVISARGLRHVIASLNRHALTAFRPHNNDDPGQERETCGMTMSDVHNQKSEVFPETSECVCGCKRKTNDHSLAAAPSSLSTS